MSWEMTEILVRVFSGIFYLFKHNRLKAALNNACICSRQTQKVAEI
ncbi:hypothetical protein NE611_07195 [Anaerostipes caccae]|nr:hypothetical protein [Anaerostipes caccae]MCQ4985357.1 hypothetical protein [Anaerostipes caccae]